MASSFHKDPTMTSANPPKLGSALWQLDALDVAARIRRKVVSAEEVTRSVLDRIGQVNPRINALAEVMAEEAMAAAQAADGALARGEAPGALHGVPVSIKVNVDKIGRAHV